MNTGLIGGFAAAVLTPVILRAVAGPSRSARQSDTWRVLDYGNAYQALIGFVATLFSTLALLAWYFPGKSGIVPIRPIAVFLGFALLALVTLVLMRRARVLWNEEQIEGANLAGKRCRVPWSDLREACYVPWATSVRLTFEAGRTICVSPLMQGFADFFSDLERHCAAANLVLPDVPPNPYA